jgi:carbamoyl-phosphate synthase large subunit
LKTILASGASGIVGYGILRTLRTSGTPLKLIGTSIYGDSAAPAFCDIFERAPPTDDSDYLAWLRATIEEHHVDLIIPGIEIDMYKWAQHVPDIGRSGAVAVLNNLDLIELCRDKWAFYEDLRDAGLACAIPSSLNRDFETLAMQFGLPFLLKPRRGFGSKGIVRVDSPTTFQPHQQSIGPVLMAQPIVGTDDEEFTLSAFCDGEGGLRACMTLRRKLSRDGFTDKAEVVASDEFVATVETLCRRFRPIGPTNFQFRRCRDGLKLLEINPRVSSSTSIRAAFGYNESVMAVEFYLDGKIPVQPDIRSGRAVRYTDECIFYDDRLHL